MTQSPDINTQLLELFLPEGILDHFIITNFEQSVSGQACTLRS